MPTRGNWFSAAHRRVARRHIVGRITDKTLQTALALEAYRLFVAALRSAAAIASRCVACGFN
jgi:hypothetical protein